MIRMIYYLVVGLEHGFYFPSYMGCHPKPIDEVHHFLRWLLHHQTDGDIICNG